MRFCKHSAPTGPPAGTPDVDRTGAWPEPLDDREPTHQADIFAAKVEIAKKRDEADRTRAQSEAQAELDLNAEYYKAIFEVGKGSLDRSRAGAESVQKAAAAIVTLYTGILAVSFSVADRPLPVRGVAPAIMLGAAIVFATFYVAYLGRAGARWVAAPVPSSLARAAQQRRAITFLSWMREATLTRAYWLRAAVVALGFGVMLLPVPFVSIGEVKVPVVNWTLGTATVPTQKQDWPLEPSTVTSPDLAKILFAAQVKEAATLRSEAKAPPRAGWDGFWLAVTAILLAASLALARLGGRGEEVPGPLHQREPAAPDDQTTVQPAGPPGELPVPPASPA